MLDKIIEYKREELAIRKRACPLFDLEKKIPALSAPIPVCPRFTNQEHIQLIAEVKKASPSRGVIRQNFDPVSIAGIYRQNGAQAISVLTDQHFFQGSLDYLKAIKSFCRIPVLRKDFIIDPYQVTEARVYGADFILLIAAVLSPDQLRALMQKADELSVEVLLEVHDEEDMKTALEVMPVMIGINNRNLKTFQTDLQTTFDLLGQVPDGMIVISESGINSREDVLRLEDAGVDGVLIGEAFMREEDIGQKVRELMGRAGPGAM
jgi:indole-3-glycerol phosphate synthase